MNASPGSEEEQEKINFFIPMVDLMVAVLFVFIIIIMVLVLLIREEVSRAPSPSDAKIINQNPTLITNESAVGKLLDNITQKSLKREGSDFKLDEGTLRANIAVPDDNRVFKN